jgi:hypothetical protein
MTEPELIQLWMKTRQQIIIAQLAPTALLITTVALLQFGLAQASWPVRLAALGILLASGILGALAEYSAANEGQAAAKELAALPKPSLVAARIASQGKWQFVVRFVTPAIFVAIFVCLAYALLA